MSDEKGVFATRYMRTDPDKKPLGPSIRSGFISLDQAYETMGAINLICKTPNTVIYDAGDGEALCFSKVAFAL